MRSHGTLASRDDWTDRGFGLEKGSAIRLGIYRPGSTIHTRMPTTIDHHHTHLARLCLHHTTAQARSTRTFRQYYLRVSVSVSQVHVRYIKLDSRKKNALGSREDVAGPWNAQTSRVLYARDFENEINDLGSWVSEDVATSSNPSSIHPSIHSLLLTD